MEFSIDEILANTNSYFFYKKGDLPKDKKYRVSIFKNDLKDNVIFCPFLRKINLVVADTFTNIEHSVQNGVRGFFFDEERMKDKKYVDILNNIIAKYKDNIDFIIMVDNTFNVICKLAYYVRTSKLKKDVKVFAVTGSIGKTSTTEMIYAIFSQHNKLYRGDPAINIKIRIMHKFLEVDPDVDIMLFECSGHVKGYLRSYSETLMPDGVIVTRAVNENIETYGSIEGITKEKISLISYMNENGVAVLDDTPFFRTYGKLYKARQVFVSDNDYEFISTSKDGSTFKYKGVEYKIPVVGIHQITNAIKAIEFALQMGLSEEEIKSGLLKFKVVGNRWVVDKYKDDIEFITDCPNNPSEPTLIQNVKTFMDIYKDAPYKRLATSRMISLGTKENEKATYLRVANFLSELPLDEIILINEKTRIMYNYLKEHSNIKLTEFNRPDKLDKNDPLCKYIIETLDRPQAFLIKALFDDDGIDYANVKDVVREELKNRLL